MLESSLTVVWFSWTNHSSLLCIATNEIASICIDNRLRQIQMAFFVFAKVGKGRLSSYVERFWNEKSFICSRQFVSLLYKTNRFHVAMCLFSNRSQKMSQCGKNISDTLGYRLVCHFFCSYHILTSSMIYYWADVQQHGIYLLSILHYPLKFEMVGFNCNKKKKHV